MRYYRSTDATISVSDTAVGTDEVSALVPSGQVSEGIDLTAPLSTGTYYYGACVDAVTNESDTTNNCSGSLQFTVPEPETGLGGGVANGERQESRDGGEFHVVGDGEQRWGRGIGGDDAAVLPVDGRDDHDIGHGGGYGRGGCSCGIGDQCAVDIAGGRRRRRERTTTARAWTR